MAQKAVAKRKNQGEPMDITQVLAIKDRGGNLKAFKTMTQLTVADGTLVSPFGMNCTLVSAEGYKAQARDNGINVVNAPTVVVDGQQQANPHVMRDEHGRICMVYARAIAFGYTPLGSFSVVDRTVIFDVNTYRAVDLIAQVKRFPSEFVLGPLDMEKPGAKWSKYPVDESTAVFVNLEAPEAGKYLSNVTNRLKKAVEIAQTFAARNATKAHPNIKMHKLDNGGSQTVVPGICWRAVKGEMQFDLSRFNDAVLQIEGVASNGGSAPGGNDGVEIEVDKGVDKIHEEAEAVEYEEVAIGEEEPPEETEEKPAEPARRTKQRNRLIAELVNAANDRELADVYEAACDELKIDMGLELDFLEDDKLASLHQEVFKK